MKKTFVAAATLALLLGSFSAAYAFGYISPTNAYLMLNPVNDDFNNPVYLLDVRTPEEYAAGHPGENAAGQGAWLDEPDPKVFNIPVKVRVGGTLVLNDQFVQEVQSQFALNDYLLVICASGTRSLLACQLLDGIGYAGLYDIPTGFTGPEGWLALGLPSHDSMDPVPVPASLLLLGSGLAGVAGVRGLRLF